MHQELTQRDVQPDVPVVDTGSVDADVVASSQAQGIRLVGPALMENRWQTNAGQGLGLTPCHLYGPRHEAMCPQGQSSHRWTSLEDCGRWDVGCAKETGASCPVRQARPKAPTSRRVVPRRPQAAHEALPARRAEPETDSFRQESHTRADSEGTLSQGVRRCGWRQARSRG